MLWRAATAKADSELSEGDLQCLIKVQALVRGFRHRNSAKGIATMPHRTLKNTAGSMIHAERLKYQHFSKVHAQMKEDHHGMGRQRGVVVELPPGEDEDPDGAGRTFVVQVRTDITNKLFGIDPSVTKLRRQLAQQSSQVEELEAEGEAMAAQLAEQKSTIVRWHTIVHSQKL